MTAAIPDLPTPWQEEGKLTSPERPLLPRITIQFCTQCKWMLRAAYFAQELLSTFSTSLGEVALQPATGGVFTVQIQTTLKQQDGTGSGDDDAHRTSSSGGGGAGATITRTLWDRKTDGGFPETKELKRRVRDVIEPDRDLGHVDRDHKRPATSAQPPNLQGATAPAPAADRGGGETGSSGHIDPVRKIPDHGSEPLPAGSNAPASSSPPPPSAAPSSRQSPPACRPAAGRHPEGAGSSEESKCEDCA